MYEFGAAVLTALGLRAPEALADATPYRPAPGAIQDVLSAPVLPQILLSPSRDTLALLTPLRYPPVADLARPMLRLAGLRIDPRTNGTHHAFADTSMTLVRVRDGHELPVALPPDARITALRFSPNGKQFALANATPRGTELYVGSTADGSLARVPGVRLNGIFGNPMWWLPDSARLVVLGLARIGAAPLQREAPSGPVVQETAGKAGAIVTYEDLLANPYDEALFDFYANSHLTLVDSATKRAVPFGSRAVYTGVAPAPNGRYLLVERLHRPYSYLFPYFRFPSEMTVLDLEGASIATVAQTPLLDDLPVDGVPVGPRDFSWQPNEPASLVWWEALDGGDPRTEAPQRDKLLLRAIGDASVPQELARTTARAAGVAWLAGDPRAFVSEYDRETRATTTSLLDLQAPGSLKPLWPPLRDGDRYNDPGFPVMQTAPNGSSVIQHLGDVVYLRGAGYCPEGIRPFLDRFDLADGSKVRLFHSELAPLDVVVTILDVEAKALLLQRQSPVLPPNAFLQTASGARALTAFADPTPIVRSIQRRVVTYKRADGVDLSFTLYLPPDYREGTRLPTLLWAYPQEFIDASVASQTINNAQTFAQLGGASEIFMALAGYAVLGNASIPIVGEPQTVNDTYVEQLVASATAAIDTAVEIGVTDANRVAAGGHSYGAFMTMNLLAHSDLFRAGIARSGAYNRTLTPFGFQSERRSYWEATELYTKMSPFTYANKVSAPVLMIHGMKDENSGTFPVQSERMFAAIKGNGGTARLVMLPAEGHGYLARETVETVLAEMVDWLDKWVKNAPTRAD
jgi:dipeptidyl aminopeptidase/acylaminoacyl peptidase